MKQCTKCGEVKPPEDYHVQNKSKDGRASCCKVCKNAIDNNYYRTSDHRKKSIREFNSVIVAQRQAFLWDYLLEHPCVDCGETDPIVLQFDHVRGIKEYNVTEIFARLSMDVVLLEISKCEVRCANCHVRATIKRAGTWRGLFSDNGSTFLS